MTLGPREGGPLGSVGLLVSAVLWAQDCGVRPQADLSAVLRAKTWFRGPIVTLDKSFNLLCLLPRQKNENRWFYFRMI